MQTLARALGGLILLAIALSFITVVTRYVFDTVWIPVQELALYAHAFALMLGISVAFYRDAHVRVDVFYQRLKKPQQARINAFGFFCLALPFMLFLLYSGFGYVTSAWMRLEKSPETGGLPLVWLLKTLILLMPLTVLIAAWLRWRRPPEQS